MRATPGRRRPQIASTRMDGGGAFTFGDSPDEDPAEEDAFHRGWIAPEDRLWRHPSELSAAPSSPARPVTRDPWRERRGAIAVGTIGAAAVVAAAAVVLTLANSPSARTATDRLNASETSLVTLPPMGVGMRQAISAVESSLVELAPLGAASRSTFSGVVLPGGYLVVTSASAVSGVSRLEVVTSGGKQVSGEVLAADPASGVAVVSTAGGLDAARFADESVGVGELEATACMGGSTKTTAPRAAVALGVVRLAGQSIQTGGGSALMDAIAAETPVRGVQGGALLDAQGQVTGILESQRRAQGGTGTLAIFVPASLAEGVAHELASLHRIQHGWVGVQANDAPSNAGAQVQDVFPGSPAAAAGIAPGDVVTAVNGHRVMSTAELQARLYTITPGQDVSVTVQQGATLKTVSVELADHAGG
jgi:S1-C subfamily serine protease